MTVVFKRASEQMFKATDVLCSKETLVNALVEAMLVNQTEAYIDMIIDMQKDDGVTREGVNATLTGVKDSAWDFWNDIIYDFDRAVKARLEASNYGAAVTGIKYDLAGDVTDIEVDISVS